MGSDLARRGDGGRAEGQQLLPPCHSHRPAGVDPPATVPGEARATQEPDTCHVLRRGAQLWEGQWPRAKPAQALQPYRGSNPSPATYISMGISLCYMTAHSLQWPRKPWLAHGWQSTRPGAPLHLAQCACLQAVTATVVNRQAGPLPGQGWAGLGRHWGPGGRHPFLFQSSVFLPLAGVC